MKDPKDLKYRPALKKSLEKVIESFDELELHARNSDLLESDVDYVVKTINEKAKTTRSALKKKREKVEINFPATSSESVQKSSSEANHTTDSHLNQDD
ncbi:MAG: hypothetical protein HAW67_02330 [Endozoicomonadaceae bacterium]|nr:hypothetical protein [Endozoicomonadaceae bacterium]